MYWISIVKGEGRATMNPIAPGPYPNGRLHSGLCFSDPGPGLDLGGPCLTQGIHVSLCHTVIDRGENTWENIIG